MTSYSTFGRNRIAFRPKHWPVYAFALLLLIATGVARAEPMSMAATSALPAALEAKVLF